MVRFSTVIKQFSDQGEKTGWTYIEVPHEIAEKLKPHTSGLCSRQVVSFFFKGPDHFSISHSF